VEEQKKLAEEEAKKRSQRCGEWATTRDKAHYAYLCHSCSFGNGADECCVCGEWTASSKVPAFLCHSHTSGFGQSCCSKCNENAPNGVRSQLCHSCGWSTSGELCCKLG
jgi:hypothetical protein